MFKDKLCKLMDERSISAYKLSKETGIPQSGISQYRSGKVVPGLDKAQIIADYFGVSVDSLLSVDDEKIFISDNGFLSIANCSGSR